MINIVCTSKPGDGLLRYSYEHNCALNSLGIKSQLIIIPNSKHNKEEYIKSIKDQYKTYENVIFDFHTPTSDEITLVLGRSMITLAYKDKDRYTKDQLLTLHLLFGNKVIAVYSENHPKEYPLALEYFKPNKVFDLCDFNVYPNGEGIQYKKIINFDLYKPVKNEIQYKHLFLGTNEIYYKEIEKHIHKYPDHGIVTYNEKWINPKLNNLFAPVENILGKFESYVYTKPNFDPAPRLFVEFKWLGKNVDYVRSKDIKDGGMVYWNRPMPTKKIYKDNLNVLLKLINDQKKPYLKKRIKENIIDNLWIDKSIQTDIDYDRLHELKNNFDISLCDPIECVKSLNENKYYIIDGLHRVLAMKLLGIDKTGVKIKINVQSEKLIEDTYMSDDPILVDKETGI
tara:strand:- start:732 stop:1925 length:1194 start_codon:yes stop_codon:yes gene_type:complete